MYIVKGVEVSSSIIDIAKHTLSLYTTLYDKALEAVIEQVIEPKNWQLTLCNVNGDTIPITRDSIIELRTPLINHRVCSGEITVTVSSNMQDNIMYIRKTSTICTRKAVNNFCILHKDTAYSRYLMYVYGLRELLPDTGLALIPHMVYILYLGGQELKVGIANAIKNINRLYEQIFIYASIVMFTDNVANARNIEKILSNVGVKDRVRIIDRIDWLKKVEPGDLHRYLRNFVLLFLRYIRPALSSLGIGISKMFIPVIRFSDKCFENVRNATMVYDRSTLNNLEGRAIIEDYCIGGVLLKIGYRRYYIPYQLIRDHALNIDIIK